MIRTLKARCTGKNFYTEKFVTVTGIKYEIIEASWYQLTEFWILRVKRSK